MALSDMVRIAGGLGKDRCKVPPPLEFMLLLMTVSAAMAQMASVPQVCRLPDNSVTLTTPGKVFVQTEDEILRIVMQNPNCDKSFLAAQNVNLNETSSSSSSSSSSGVRNLTSGNGREVGPWYELDFVSDSDGRVLKIGSRVIQRFPKEKSPSACDTSEIEFFFQRTSILARSCSEMNRTFLSDLSFFDILQHSAGENRHSSLPIRRNVSIINALGVLNDLITTYLKHPQSDSNFANDQLPSVEQNFANWPDGSSVKLPSDEEALLGLPTLPPSNSDDANSFDAGYPYRNNREESVIPIFIGVIAFVVSMCIRFCLCRRKRVVTTVAVIRSIQSLESSDAQSHHQENLDLPPAYADILNEIAQDCPPDSYMDLPPSYDDIGDETTPPPYSEIEAQSLPVPGMSGGDVESAGEGIHEEAEEEEDTAVGDGNTEPVSLYSAGPADRSVAEDSSSSSSSSSSLARALTSQFRSLRTQFAFRPLQEE